MSPPHLETLRQKIIRLEGARSGGNRGAVRSGCRPLDELLPDGGLRRGTLAEWLAAGDGAGACTLALLAARESCRDGGVLVVLDSGGEFYPPAAVRLGIPLEQMLVVRAGDLADNLWALDQSLRCRAVAAVMAWPEKLDGRTFRRLQLAAEEGGGLGLLIRPGAARHEPSWADVRFLVEPLPRGPAPNARRLQIDLLRCRGSCEGRSVEVEIDDETHTVHPPARRAEPTWATA
jgi:protein ImuA